MIVVTVFLSILIHMEFNLVQNRKETCHHDHIPFTVKGIGIIVFSVYTAVFLETLTLLNTVTGVLSACCIWYCKRAHYSGVLLFVNL